MIAETFILLAGTLLGIVMVYAVPSIKNRNFNAVLTFSGAYLFSITVVHILPELFTNTSDPFLVGIFVLVGFYIQIIIGYFSTGVEHGHIHKHHVHAQSEAILLFASLMLHSILEGSLLVHPLPETASHNHSDNLLAGIVLHKFPESIALSSVLLSHLNNKKLIAVMLTLYLFASPFGLYLSNNFLENKNIDGFYFTCLYAIVAGNFLHISTTIFFESDLKEHRFSLNKLLLIAVAAIIACVVEIFG